MLMTRGRLNSSIEHQTRLVGDIPSGFAVFRKHGVDKHEINRYVHG